MARATILAYAVACYVFFLGVFVYAIGFVGNLGVPTSVDAGGVSVSLGAALLMNVGLLTAFALQHSVMARPAFKRWWTRFVPAPAERATYVLFSSLAFVLLFVFWRPIDTVVWQVQGEFARNALTALYLGGWALLLYVTLLIDHFDLFGLRQAWLHYTGKTHSKILFVTPALYTHVRHPLYVAWLVIFWSAPTMTLGHLLLSVMTTGYILVAIRFEEHDLIAEFGDQYRSYREATPMLIPRLGRAGGAGRSGRTPRHPQPAGGGH